MRDRVFAHGLRFACRIGIHDFERDIEQAIEVDFEAATDFTGLAPDRHEGLVDYYAINRALSRAIQGQRFGTLEELSQLIARLICRDFPVQEVRVVVTKRPADMPNARSVAVECVRTPADFPQAP